jgi:phage/plasmid-like protein (TIGR03299 family)
MHYFESGFFTNEPAWHGLGKVLQQPPTTAQAIAEAGLDWEVLEHPVFRLKDGEYQEIEGHKTLVRSSDERVLGVVTKHYHPLQNIDAFRWFDFLLHEGDASLEAAGSLKNGRRVWVLAKLNHAESEVTDGDEVRPYLLLHNSHDGSTAVWIQFTPIRVVCWNTLSFAAESRREDEANFKAIRLRHSSSMNEQLNIAQNVLNLSQQTVERLESYVSELLNIRDLENLHRKKSWDQILENFQGGRGNQGQTVWDAYNGVTEWIDYHRGRSAATRLESAWFGDGANLRQKAHEVALAMI